MLRRFESLGDNCELGLVQVAVGVDQMGFFRFNNSNFEALLAVLENGFRDFEDPRYIELETACNDELIVVVPRYGFRYHTFQTAGQVDVDALLAQQTKVLQWLARKMLEDLRSGEKIFLRKDSGDLDEAQILRLYAALQSYGDNRLLWVSCSDDQEKVGRVEPSGVPGKGVLRGYMDAFSQYEDGRSFSYRWFELCRAALQIQDDLPERHGAGASSPARDYRLCSINDSRLRAARLAGGDGGFVVDRARVHGPDGIVTQGDLLIQESLPDSWQSQVREDLETGARVLELPEAGYQVQLRAAYHLFAHSKSELDQRYCDQLRKHFSGVLGEGAQPILLIPEREDFVVLQSLRELVHARMPRLSVPQGAAISVDRLLLPG